MRYDRLKPASAASSRAAKGSSKKRDTAPELALRRALRGKGLRSYRIDPPKVLGRPDVVFGPERIAVFCDGDFWHGRDFEKRIEKLQSGHNAPYWVAKIKGNVARDRRVDAALVAEGWEVFRFWESEVKRDAESLANRVAQAVHARRRAQTKER